MSFEKFMLTENFEVNTCWDCESRIGEECSYDGHEVFPDSEICDQFSKTEVT